MKKIFTFLLLYTVFFRVYSQDSLSLKKANHQIGITTSYIHTEVQQISLGGIVGYNYGEKGKQYFGSGLCLDAALNSKNFTLGPRLFFEGTVTNYLGLRLNIINYLRQTDNDLRVNPEIYITHRGLFNIGLGYSFRLSNANFTDISLYRVSFTYNFIK